MDDIDDIDPFPEATEQACDDDLFAPTPAHAEDGPPHLVDTLSDVEDLPELDGAQASPDPHAPEDVLAAVVPFEQPPSEEKSARQREEKRGRKRGSTAKELALKRLFSGALAQGQQTDNLTRPEICYRAGKARQARTREAPAAASAAATEVSSLSAAASKGAIVEFGGLPKTIDKSLFQSAASFGAITDWNEPASTAKQPKHLEKGVLKTSLAQISKQLLAEKLDVSRRTITRRLRLLAFCILLVRRRKAEAKFPAITEHLQQIYGHDNVKTLHFLLRQKYDEMSMRIRLKTKEGLEFAIAKIIQVQLVWAGLWKVHDKYLRYRTPVPASLSSIESCTVSNMRFGLDRHCLMPTCAQSFEGKSRIPVRDQHASNIGSDQSYYRDFPDEVPQAFSCQAHIEMKVQERLMLVFPNDKKGILHTNLAFQFGGALTGVKDKMKTLAKERLSWVDCAGESPESYRCSYRESVYQRTCDLKTIPRGAGRSTMGVIYLRRRRLVNGRLQKRKVFEHLCFGRHCCRDAEHCAEQIDEMFSGEIGVRDWAPHRWRGVEEATDWILFWALAHGLLPDALELQFAKDSPKVAAADAHAADEVLAILDLDGDVGETSESTHLPEDDLGMPDPVKDQTQEQRQSTFRSNALIWFRSGPWGRTWIWRSIVKHQQVAVHRWIKSSGAGARKRELARRTRGEPPEFPVVRAAEGWYTDSEMQAWGRMMADKAEWQGLLPEYHNHELSIHAFRGLSSVTCTKFELQVCLFLRSWAFRGYLLLSRKAFGIAIETALALVQTFYDNPCLLPPFWWEHVRRFPSVEAVMSDESLAILAFHADEIELDSIEVEAGNAQIHRTIKRAVQQKMPSLADCAASWLLKMDRAIHVGQWGAPTYSSDDPVEADDGKRAMKGGGGGLARAFISLKSRTMKLPNGRPDLKAIAAAYRCEKNKEHSDVLESLRADALAATMARRQQFQQGSRWQMSSFGTVHHQTLKKAKLQSELRALSGAAAHHAEGPLEESAVAAAGAALGSHTSDGSLAIVPHAGLEGQISLLRRMARQEATDERARAEKADSEVRSSLQKPIEFCGKTMASPEGVPAENMRCLPGDLITDIYIHDDVAKFVEARCSNMVKKSPNAVKAAERLWTNDHTLLSAEKAPDIGEIPSWAKPSFCEMHGGGRCLCKGKGLIVQLAARNLAAQLCKRAPRASSLRKLLMGAWIVMRINTVWVSVGLTYFRPRRPTLIEVDLLPHLVWGHRVVKPRYCDDKSPKTTRLIDVLWDMALDDSLEFELCRLVTFKRMLPDWAPDRLLTIQSLSETMDIPCSITFWDGARAEVAKEAEKQRKAELAAARKRARDAAAPARPERPAGEPRAKAKRTPQQEAVARARAEAAHADPLPLMDVVSPHEEEDDFWDSLVEPDPDAPPGEQDVDGLSPSEDLDRTLASLDQRRGPGASSASTAHEKGVADSDMLDYLFADEPGDCLPGAEDFGKPFLEVHPAPEDGPDDAEYSPSSPGGEGDEHEGRGPASGEAEGSESDDGDAPDSRWPRVPHSEDRSAEQPRGCKMRKYETPGKTPLWLGLLPVGLVDSQGRSSRRRSYRPGLRSEAEAIDIIELWLATHGDVDDRPLIDSSSSSTSESDSD